MGWQDRLGLLSDEEVEAYLAAVEIKGNRLRKEAKEEPPPFPDPDPED